MQVPANFVSACSITLGESQLQQDRKPPVTASCQDWQKPGPAVHIIFAPQCGKNSGVEVDHAS